MLVPRARLWGQGGYNHHSQFTDEQTKTLQVVFLKAPLSRGMGFPGGSVVKNPPVMQET